MLFNQLQLKHYIQVRHELLTCKKVFGISSKKQERDNKMKSLMEENEELKFKMDVMSSEMLSLKKELGKMKDEKFSEYLDLLRERNARSALYKEYVDLEEKLKELTDSGQPVSETYGDPMVLRIALDRCREQLSYCQRELKKMKEEYADSVPRRDFDNLESKYYDITKSLGTMKLEYEALHDKHKRVSSLKKSIEDELLDVKERCSEMERAGTPRPRWEICADFIGGGKDRWKQLSHDRSSRDKLMILLKELGPAAETEHLEYFEGLGSDPIIPPYLQHEGKVRNLRLSRREISVIINDIWQGKLKDGMDMTMQEYVTKYFEDRYQQQTVRAEWAYNLCAGAEQMLDDPQIKLFWGVLHGHLCENIYWELRNQWVTMKDELYKASKDRETVTIEEFEKIARSRFPLKSEVDIKNMSEVVRKQLKLKINSSEVNLDKLFNENEEGFDRLEFAKELYRQRQFAQDKYIREVIAILGGKNAANKMISVDNLKRAFAVVDPAIDHKRMERYIRWAFSDQTSELSSICPLTLRAIVTRLASGDIERVGPRSRGASLRRNYK